jgi:hypothetical protein
MKRSLNLKTSSELSDKVSLHLREMGSSATRSFSMSAMSMETADCEKGTVPNFLWRVFRLVVTFLAHYSNASTATPSKHC